MKLFKDRKEFLIAFSIAVAAAFFSLLPTIYAWLNTPRGYWFTGVSSFFDPWDINTYFAAMQQGFGGSWLYHASYNLYDTRGLPIHFTYLFLGHLARIFNLSIPFVYHLASFVLGIFFLLAVYLFVRFFLKDKFWGLLCLYLVAFGGGFGFMGMFLPDAAFPDATVFQTLHLPHFILEQLLFLGAVFFSYQALTKSEWLHSFLAAVAGFGLSFIHPYTLVVADVVLGIFFVGLFLKDKNWRRVRFLLPLIFVSVMALTYFFKVFYLDVGSADAFLLHRASMFFLTPSPPIMLLGYGLIAAFAVAGACYLWRDKTPLALLLLSWFLGQFLILYLPVWWQRIMIKGFFIVLCLLAVWGMRALRLRKNWVALIMILFFSGLTNLVIQGCSVAIAQKDNPWVYLTDEKHQALEWLQQNSFDKVILASPELATMVSANSSNFAYMAYQDARSDAVGRKRVEDFYLGLLASPQEFLQENQIDYVIFGQYPRLQSGVKNEKRIPKEDTPLVATGGLKPPVAKPRFTVDTKPACRQAGESDLEATDYLENVYENEKVKIFKVL